MNEFNNGDKVEVRDNSNDVWKTALFIGMNPISIDEYKYTVITQPGDYIDAWKQCRYPKTDS